MNKYQAYKPSGIEWIGEIPAHWEVNSIKHVAQIVNGSTPSSSVEEYWDGDITWITPADFNNFSKVIDDSENKITAKGYKSCGTTLLPMGSVILTTRAPIGNVLLAGKELCTNQGCKSLVTKRIHSSFLYYLLSISQIELNTLGQGTTFLELSTESLGTFKVPMPEYVEQASISAYLDSLTQKIDKLIANKKAQVERLRELRQIEINNAVTKGLNPNAPLKDSGIDWLGEIPGHWEVKRLKNVAEVVLGKMLQNDDTGSDNLKPYLRSFNVQWERVDLSDVKEMWFSENEMQQYRLMKFDIVVSEGGEVGRAALWLDEIEECYIQNSVHKVTCRNKVNPYYLLYQFSMLGKAGFFETIINKVSIGHLTREKLVACHFLVPTLEEQLQIANHLQQRTTAIDKLIKNTESQISKLQELRKITIYEAVTCKVKCHA